MQLPFPFLEEEMRKVTEKWLVHPKVLERNLSVEFDYNWSDPKRLVEGRYRSKQYRDLPVQQRDESAQFLFSLLTEEQVKTFREKAYVLEGKSKIYMLHPTKISIDPWVSIHPRVVYPNGTENCTAFGHGHDLLPICDRVTSLLMALKSGVKNYHQLYSLSREERK